MNKPGKSTEDHEATAKKLGVWIDGEAGWVCAEPRANSRLLDSDVTLMLRAEGYSLKGRGFYRISEIGEFRLWCLEHRRL